ncbi:hypothetical protein B5K08_02075 [Rhizobium leguminosarum bv. trifolii]|uniref:Uncharacterized protein n=1 Tax=Rhizobium leguminosarum bv. trifolii TaxID=386 RepID=A0A3E1C081_RHILT|nr:hypothetical protein [Rhizobium leguminosarum]RFC00673.1 hypothetical protein B5K08_02075 [Rhizobium leguminosarum bv. trifolii]RFC01130.1 hypothetical protein B5K10_02075 [Rhizobium leguminosarum bv. trifolii]
MIAAYIDEIIMFCAGPWMTSVGFGYLSLPGYSANPPLVRHFKWMGPMLLAIAVVLAAAHRLAISGMGEAWRLRLE